MNSVHCVSHRVFGRQCSQQENQSEDVRNSGTLSLFNHNSIKSLTDELPIVAMDGNARLSGDMGETTGGTQQRICILFDAQTTWPQSTRGMSPDGVDNLPKAKTHCIDCMCIDRQTRPRVKECYIPDHIKFGMMT